MLLNKQSGQISQVLLVVAIALLVVIVAVFFAIRVFSPKEASPIAVEEEVEPEPVYKAMAGNVEFSFVSAVDIGNTLLAADAIKTRRENLTTTERFIKVTISAQNKGKLHTENRAWQLGSIVDGEGRVFIENEDAKYWAPQPSPCGAVLGPEFEPTKCVKIYEVAKVARDLKIEAIYEKETVLLDLKITR